MNVLDLPLGKVPVAIPPGYIDVATDAYSINLVKSLVKIEDMSDTTSWGTAATPNAVSWFHCDDAGFGSAIWVQSGGKWWVMARRKNVDPLSDEMSDIKTFLGWNVEEIEEADWEVEAVYLQGHCVL